MERGTEEWKRGGWSVRVLTAGLYRAMRAQVWEVALMALRCAPALGFRAV